MMQKRLVGLMLALVAALCFTSALAENGDTSALNWEELTAWAESYKERAMTSTVLNDPTAARMAICSSTTLPPCIWTGRR